MKSSISPWHSSPPRLSCDSHWNFGCRLNLQRQRRKQQSPNAQPPDTEGVRNLLERDKKFLNLPEEDPFAEDGPSQSAKPDELPVPPAGRQAARARSQLIETGTSTSEPVLKDSKGQKTASQAIEEGIAVLQRGEPQQAIKKFQQALELPGRGAFRLKGSAKEYSCASEGEEIAALYNLACAYAALGQTEAALASIEGAIETGFTDWDVLRSDSDLQSLQGSALERLISRSASGSTNFLSRFNPFRR